jgi:hypothetical protein
VAYVQTFDELTQHLAEQKKFLQKSCAAYDAGDVAEAKRIAHSIRVLLHDTTSSTSLLKHLGMKGRKFYNSCMPVAIRSDVQQPIAYLIGSDILQGRFVPFYDANKAQSTYIDFDSWWSMTVLSNHDQSITLSRKELILAMANKDGGSHIDSSLDEKYAAFSRLNSMGHLVAYNIPLSPEGGLPKTLEGVKFEAVPLAEFATVRQIGHEVLETLAAQIEIKIPNDSLVIHGITLRG